MNEPIAADTPARASLWEDFLDIFYAPREVFERRKEAGYGLVLLILTLLVTALFFASQGPLGDAYTAEFTRSMQNAGGAGQQMSAEQMAQAQRMGSIFGTIAMLIFFPLGVVVCGVALWALGKLFGFSAGVSAAILVLTYAQFPRLLQSVVALLQGLFFNPQSLAATSVGPARFVDPETTSAVLLAQLMRLDIFYIWSTALIALGARVIGRVPTVQAAILAILVWVVGALPALLGGMFSG